MLDDLQWADVPTLNIIEVLMKDPDYQYLLIIGAYRDKEVTETDPLLSTIHNIEQCSGCAVKRISLEALNIEYTNQMIADSLRCTRTGKLVTIYYISMF